MPNGIASSVNNHNGPVKAGPHQPHHTHMNLQNAKIIDFHTGQSNCAVCGTGIKNIVVVRDTNGATHHIGMDCATHIGMDAWQLKNRITHEQRAKAESDHSERVAKQIEANRARIAKRTEQVKHITSQLRSIGGDFYASLANQLESGTVSSKQSWYVAKAICGRLTKANNDQFNGIRDICEFQNP